MSPAVTNPVGAVVARQALSEQPGLTEIEATTERMRSRVAAKRDAALAYAARSWPIIPLHGIRDGSCACITPDCTSVGKHPVGMLVPHGLKERSTDEATIRRWWTHQPGANVGVVTGAPSGLVVLDVDPRHGGDERLAELERQYGPLPRTIEAATGGAGRHLFFIHPG